MTALAVLLAGLWATSSLLAWRWGRQVRRVRAVLHELSEDAKARGPLTQGFQNGLVHSVLAVLRALDGTTWPEASTTRTGEVGWRQPKQRRFGMRRNGLGPGSG